MKVIVGKLSHTDFQILGESGADITAELCVKSLTITADANDSTMVTLVCYGSAEIETENVTIKVTGP